MDMDTIFALASASGKAGVSVIRISGDASFAAVERLTGSLPYERGMALRSIRDDAGEVIDRALVLTFLKNASFTGEDVVELHLHGSKAIVSAVMSLLGNCDGLRLADPGEFTRRALENERLDIAQIEGLGDLIEAETEAQRRQAMRVFSGALGDKVELWREKLIRAAALLEATIDFADEDVPVDVTPEVEALLQVVCAELETEIKGSYTGERVRDGFEIAILGPPNIGKSTLLNTLAGREAAITSDIAGTTRDVIEVRLDLHGLPVTFLDTAGLRESEDHVEKIGIERAKERAAAADLRIFLKDDSAADLGIEPSEDDISLWAKADVRAMEGPSVSGRTGQGVEDLLRTCADILSSRIEPDGVSTKERHRTAMESALEQLRIAQRNLEHGPELYEITVEDIRVSVRLLESLVGRVNVDQILDEIFSSFCLGK